MDYNSLSGNSSDIKNNNNNNVKSEKSILNEKEATVQYSSNSKGVLAQVRYIIKYFAIDMQYEIVIFEIILHIFFNITLNFIIKLQR